MERRTVCAMCATRIARFRFALPSFVSKVFPREVNDAHIVGSRASRV